MPSVNISYYSKLEAVTVVVDGQKFTQREILLRYGTPADMQNAEAWQWLSSLLPAVSAPFPNGKANAGKAE